MFLHILHFVSLYSRINTNFSADTSNQNLVFRERPLGCRKNCFALTNKWNRAKCNKDKKSFISIKRVIFDFQRKLGFVGLYQTKHDKFTMAWMSANSPELRFRFYWTHSEIFYIVSTKLLHSGKCHKGNLKVLPLNIFIEISGYY